MAYNNMFPMGYGQQYYPQYPQMPSQPQQGQMQTQAQNDTMIWVSGLAGAKSYLVAPNSTVRLWDSEAPVIYIKSADASGMPSMRILDYKERKAEQPQIEVPAMQGNDFVTHAELEDLKTQLAEKIENMKGELGA